MVGQISFPHRIDHPRILALYDDRNQHGRAPGVGAGRRHPRASLTRLEIHGREALVDLAPLVQRAGYRLTQPMREIVQAVVLALVLLAFVHHRDHSVPTRKHFSMSARSSLRLSLVSISACQLSHGQILAEMLTSAQQGAC